MHDIPNVEVARHKAKAAELKLEGILKLAYNLYIWWKEDKFSYTWKLFKTDFLKRFQGITEDEFLSKLTMLQHKGSVEEFTHQ